MYKKVNTAAAGLKKYANVTFQKKEDGAWKQAVIDNYVQEYTIIGKNQKTKSK
jgi:hypothetical protein